MEENQATDRDENRNSRIARPMAEYALVRQNQMSSSCNFEITPRHVFMDEALDAATQAEIVAALKSMFDRLPQPDEHRRLAALFHLANEAAGLDRVETRRAIGVFENVLDQNADL